MTENEKLDLILEKISALETELQETKQKVGKLEVGQSELKRELIKINRKISDTYNLALDALGMSTENREWLESGTVLH